MRQLSAFIVKQSSIKICLDAHLVAAWTVTYLTQVEILYKILIKILSYFLTKIVTSFLQDSYQILTTSYKILIRSYKNLTKILPRFL